MRLASDHPDWAVGFADEVWWSRFAQPAQHAWSDDATPRRLEELNRPKNEKDPKALACYGVLLRYQAHQSDQMVLRFVEGRPVSAVTTDFLAWVCKHLAAQGMREVLLIWDNATWHKSQHVLTWLRNHNASVKQTGQGVRIVPYLLPSKSPWLNPIEPKWVHGKRAVSEPHRLLSAAELEARVYAYYRCPPEDHLTMPEKVP